MKITSKKFRNAISDIVKNMGYTRIAKDVKNSKLSETKDAVLNIAIRELAIGKGCKYLTNPITRKKTLNPRRKTFEKTVVMLKEAYKRGIDLEKKENN